MGNAWLLFFFDGNLHPHLGIYSPVSAILSDSNATRRCASSIVLLLFLFKSKGARAKDTCYRNAPCVKFRSQRSHDLEHVVECPKPRSARSRIGAEVAGYLSSRSNSL